MRLREIKWRPIEVSDDTREYSGDDIYTLAEFTQWCKEQQFIDYDGHGDFATETQVSNIEFCPSQLKEGTIASPQWATHVCWYNR